MKTLTSAVLLLSFLATPFSIAAAAVAADDVVAPGENLVVQGVPAIPAKLVEGVNPYTQFRGATISSWHPTKREMLISTRFADVPQVHYVKFPGGARTQLTFFPDAVAGAEFPPTGDGAFFVFDKGSGGNEQFQKYRFDVATGAVSLLTDGKSRNTGGVWTRAGDRLIYGSTRRNGADVDLWVTNPSQSGSDKMLAQLKGGGWGAEDVSPDDKQVVVLEEVSINEGNLWLVDLTSGNRTRVTPEQGVEKVAYGSARFSADGKGLYVTTDRESEFLRLAYVDLATKRYTYLTDPIKWDVTSFEPSRDGKTIAFVTNEDGQSVLHVLDTASGKERPKPELPVGLLGGLAWHNDNRTLGFSFLASRGVADCYSLDVAAGKVERWTFSETGGVDVSRFNEPKLVKWGTFDGRTISGWLHNPPARFTGKRPVIIDIHGGPESQARPRLNAGDSYLVNEMGVAMIFPNIRGSSGYGKTFLKLDNGFLREDAYKDVGALLDWVKTQDGLDADRVMVTGGSYGGHMTLAVATYYPERIRCALAAVAPSNLVTFLEHTSDYRRDLRRVEYGDERDPKMREFLNRTAPMTNAKKITKPLFVVQGGNDPRVPLSEAEQMVSTVRANGTPVWYLMAKDEGHGFVKKKNEDFLLYSTVMFAREYLLK